MKPIEYETKDKNDSTTEGKPTTKDDDEKKVETKNNSELHTLIDLLHTSVVRKFRL